MLRAENRFRGGLALLDRVTLGALAGSRRGELAGLSDFFFGKPAAPVERLTSPDADVYLVINASAVELVALEEFVGRAPGTATVVAFNLELDTARGDLGLPGFPPKSLHWRFLSRFKPVLFLRPRDYSRTVSVAPFLLNYSGATFREYPGPWQVLLRADDGTLACIAERGARYPLGEAKEELLAALGLNTEAPGSLEGFLRRGYKTTTWWENGGPEEESANWVRTQLC